ncbi:MAG: mechanosensitive ion channel family protein [Erysipelotrichaceae bacterium]|nr:mechanosensitive ion channel family protein [Erysipelotrichaceae bacterium]
MKEVTDYLTSKAFTLSVLIVVVTILLLSVIKKYLIKKVAYTGKDEQHRNTFIGVIFSVAQYLVIVAAVVIILRLHGVNIFSIVTGLGIMATIIGLALQDTLKDIIAGINIYNSNFYKVGDMVRYNGEECDVKYFSARVTKFQSIFTGSTYTVCNSTITSIEKIKDIKVLTLEFNFDKDSKKINKAFEKTAERGKDIENIKEIQNLGLIYFGKQGAVYGILYKCPAHKDLFARMELTKILHEEVMKSGVKPVFEGDVDVSIEK